MNLRYEFTNFTNEPFTGRFGGVNYDFSPRETRSFDPDKHYMLLIFAKQLADRELIKKIKKVGRDPKDSETWGKSLDENDRPFTITTDMRKELMKEAIGTLADTPVPVPQDEERPEAGASKETSEDIQELKKEVQELKELLSSFTTALKTQPRTINSEQGTASVTSNPISESGAEPPLNPPPSVSRQALESLARENGITDVEGKTKEQLIDEINAKQAN